MFLYRDLQYQVLRGIQVYFSLASVRSRPRFSGLEFALEQATKAQGGGE
jgi:hypothetical protein